jgi:hypothetical protein
MARSTAHDSLPRGTADTSAGDPRPKPGYYPPVAFASRIVTEGLVGFLKRGTGARPAEPAIDPTTLAREELRRAGADPDTPHPTRHFLYAPGVKAAQRLARELKSGNREIEIETSARQGYWLVVVTQSMVVGPEPIASLRAEFEAAAKPLGAEYDRWQVDLAAG